MRSIVRLRTTIWKDKKGIYIKKSLKFLRGRSIPRISGFEENVRMQGIVDTFEEISNLDECNDGIYEIRLRGEGTLIKNCSDDKTNIYDIVYCNGFELVPYHLSGVVNRNKSKKK